MPQLQLKSVARHSKNSYGSVRIDPDQLGGRVFKLSVDKDGQLSADVIVDPREMEAGNGGEVVALIAFTKAGGDEGAFYIASRDDRLALNSMKPPLPLAKLEPGALLSVGVELWMVTEVYQAVAVDAPEDLRERNCAVCGAPLSIAQVARCQCGRFSHLEKPGEPDSEDALNCFLIGGTCANCGRPATLDPVTTPEIPDRLLVPAGEDD